MSELPSLISDLAVILILGSIFSLLCKILKQPVVLGYIVAGFIAGPNFAFFQTVAPENISTWADIGVIFLLFGMGLEFSFKKMISIGKVGGKAVLFEVLTLPILGFVVGKLIGWPTIDCLLLGSMLIMSSTAIIVKTFNDLGFSKANFTPIVFGILVFEDLFAILIMVLISTLAASREFEGSQLLFVLFKLIFFLILWVILGIYLIPTLLKKVRKHLNDETLLLISMGLCLLMVVLANKVGFSSALGAFVMGSILAETVEQERIEKVIAPIKDFFAAIFFVSVGMMVDPKILVSNFWVIILIAATSILGKMIFSTLGVRLTGENLKTSMQCGFSLAQMGEFSFIIAAMGMNLGLTSANIYPIVIAVSVLTTFTTPYTMRLALPTYNLIATLLPSRFSYVLESTSASGKQEIISETSTWRQYLKTYFARLGIYIIICGFLLSVSFGIMGKFIKEDPNNWIKRLIGAAITLSLLAPLVRGIIHNVGKQSMLFITLWTENKNNHLILSFLSTIRYIIALVFISLILNFYFNLPAYIILISTLVFFAMIFNSKRLLRYNWSIESRFVKNFNARQISQTRQQNKGGITEMSNLHWVESNIYVAECEILEESHLAEKSLRNLNFRNIYNIIIISVHRNATQYAFPNGDFTLHVNDKLLFLGTMGSIRALDMDDDALEVDYSKLQTLNDFNTLQKNDPNSIMHCVMFQIQKDSMWIGKSLMGSSLMRDKCIVVAIERNDSPIINPSSNTTFKENDFVWVIGNKSVVYKLLENNYFEDTE